ncbi:MAG: hypothetical protein M1820_003368 [Bogoriella megaspora]|nr:MAG: hypothetical protein M1820_003368 [Bogoriella megaspora]
MYFSTTILVGTIASIAAAQSSVIQLNDYPNPITASGPNKITFTTTNKDPSVPVQIVVKDGPANNLNPDPIDVVTDSAEFSPDTGLGSVQYFPKVCGQNLALQISQGDEINYSGRFDITGCKETSSSASASATASTSAVTSALTTTSGSTTDVVLTTSTTFCPNSTTQAVTTSAVPTSAVPVPVVTPSVVPSNSTIAPAPPAPFSNTTLATGAATGTPSGPGATTSAPIPASPNAASTLGSSCVLLLTAVAAMVYLA